MASAVPRLNFAQSLANTSPEFTTLSYAIVAVASVQELAYSLFFLVLPVLRLIKLHEKKFSFGFNSLIP